MTHNTYLQSINWFRGAAILFVFLSHLSLDRLDSYGAGEYALSLLRNGTFFFVFISGYLFWHLKDRFEIYGYLKTKIKYVIIPYLFIMTGTITLVLLLNSLIPSLSKWEVSIDHPFSELGIIWHIFVGGGINGPLWFIPMIVLFFISSALIKKLSESPWFNLGLIISISFSLVSSRPDDNVHPFYMFFHFFGVYLFGVFCKKNETFFFKNAQIICISSLPIFITFIYFGAEVYRGEPTYFFSTENRGMLFNYMQVQKFFGAIFILTLFMHLEKINIKIKSLDLLAKYSFGIFFTHWFFITFFYRIFRDYQILQSDLITLIVQSLLSFIFTMLAVIIIKSTTRSRSRYFIGC